MAELKEHRGDVIKIMRKDDEMRRTGRIQSQRQALELAREFFGENGKEGIG